MRKWAPFLIFPLCCSLWGCAPAIIVAGAAGATVGGAIIYDKRSYSIMTQDHNARVVAQRRLDNSAVLKDHAHVSVSVFNNVALLVGQAQSADIREEAYHLIVGISGITRIYNQIVVGSPTAPMQRTTDTWITTKVRTMMLGKPGLQSTNLKVVTENNVVYLMGTVSHEQGYLATDVARKVSGVKKVVTVFKYE